MKQAKEAIDFLIFSYFGSKPTDQAEQILDRVIERAYRDASSRVLSLKDDVRDEKEGPKVKAKDKICEYMGKLKELHESPGFMYTERIHTPLCEGIEKEFCERGEGIYKLDKKGKSRRTFTYGIAQKWINMTMKYIYLLNKLFDEFGDEEGRRQFCGNYGKPVSGIAKDLHVPLDNYILGAAFEKLGMQGCITKNGQQGCITKKGQKEPQYYIVSNGKEYPWSRIPNERIYNCFRIKLESNIKVKNSGVYPIDWENTAWLEQAK